MDFAEMKKKALKFKDDMIEKGAKKLAQSGLVLNTEDELKLFIEKSKTKTVEIKETGETKTFVKKVIVIFADNKSAFFEKALVQLPVLLAKAFSQNISIKMCDIELEKLKDYGIESQPSLVVFETEKVVKIIDSEVKITKIVKGLSLDIESAIENV